MYMQGLIKILLLWLFSHFSVCVSAKISFCNLYFQVSHHLLLILLIVVSLCDNTFVFYSIYYTHQWLHSVLVEIYSGSLRITTLQDYIWVAKMECNKSLERKRERSRNYACKRRTTFKSLIDELSCLLPFSKDVIDKMDQNSLLRLALCYIRMKSLVSGYHTSDGKCDYDR